MRRHALLYLALLLAVLLPINQVGAQQDRRCFAETGLCTSGRIREFWEQNGGLAVFGFPITEQREEISRENPFFSFQTQWFERVRMELHPENQQPYDVLLGRTGDDRLRQQGRDWQTQPRETAQPNCRFFAQTGFDVCGDILAAWRANGLEFDRRSGTSEDESLALYGLPLGPVVSEMVENKPYQVQWFERARFELHPENQPPFGVLLGRLSAEVRDAALAAPGPKLLFIESNNHQLYRANADGSGQTRLPVADDLAPPGATSRVSQVSVAPNGQQLALIVRVPAAAGSEDAYLLVSDRDGQNRRTLTRDAPGYLSAPAWSPDSKQIVYAQLAPAENRVHLFAINTDGSGTRQVTSGTTNDTAPKWSPDGRTLALLSDPNAVNPSSYTYLLAVVPAQGGQPRGVSAEQVTDFQWVPGGNELVFATKDEPTQIVALNPATSAQRTIIKEDNGVFGPSLSPDGSKIAYYRCCWPYNSPIVVRDFVSKQEITVANGQDEIRWSPDSKLLAFREDRRTDRVGVVRSLTGGSQVTTLPSSETPVWLP